MANSVALARIIGPILVVVAVGVLVNRKAYGELIQDFAANKVLVFMSGVLALLGGLLVVQYHNVWELHWSLIITILGWSMILKGATRIVFPKAVSKALGSHKKHGALMIVAVVVLLVMGLFLAVMGYRG